MKPETTPTFSFTRQGKTVLCWFNNHPQKTNEGKEQWIGFERECSSELEAIFLHDYLKQFEHLIHKEYFTQGYEARKKKQTNYYL